MASLIKKGISVKLLMVGSGPLEKQLKKLVEQLNLHQHVTFTGQVNNIIDYMGLADLQVHVSESEASSNVVKEFSLLHKTSIVCNNVGDFNDYCNDNTAYIVPKDVGISVLANTIEKAFKNKELLIQKGQCLNQLISNNFSMEKVLPQYENLLNG